ncbi:MAG TPA: 2-oxoglutarate dehydrogenase complex dihydrolipoyllysine-residue succinyltransferase [Opitutales bacterium]|nr:2-oxoglutarate dehydrogenase complex dihydrolipoyllysine-residue succinyltransferase [Opitutales bacterium]
MASDVKIPSVGESITGGILAKWLVRDGDTVRADQPLFSFETDKVTADVNSPAAGVIHLRAKEGDEVTIGQVVASVADAAPIEILPPVEPPKIAHTAPEAPQAGPAARKLATELKVDLAAVEGSGKDGRATKADVAAVAEKVAGPTPTPTPAPVPGPTPGQAAPLPVNPVAAAPVAPVAAKAPETVKSAAVPLPQLVPVAQTPVAAQPAMASALPEGRTTRKKMSPLRKRIAERLVRAKSEAAMLTTFNECDMSAVMNLRKVHQDAFLKKHGIKLGFMSFFVKAVVQALKDVPQVNVQLDGDDIVENHFYDVGIAVGAPRGLVVPVVRDADLKGLAQIEKDIAEYGKKAKDGKLTIDELQGGVFTITNGGIYGSLMSTPILNTPQSAILGMHAIKERAVVVDGQVVARPMMYLALSYDHRVIDGKEAVTFLVKVKEAIEDPIRLLFEV